MGELLTLKTTNIKIFIEHYNNSSLPSKVH